MIGGAQKDRGILSRRHIVVIATVIAIGLLELALTFYVATIENELPLTILEQRQDLINLSQGTTVLAERTRLARALSTSDAIADALHEAEDLARLLDEIRKTYNLDTLVGTASVYAVLNPALMDMQSWLRDGIHQLPPQSDTVLALVEQRAVRARQSMARLFADADAISLQALREHAEHMANLRLVLIALAAVTLILVVFLVSYVIMRERLEEKLMRAIHQAETANAAKNDFLAVMSHELRTPLNAVIGFSQLIKDQMFGPIGQVRYVDYAKDINVSANHLLELINDVLDLSISESGHRELTLDLIRLSQPVRDIERTLEEMTAEKGHVLTLTVDDNLRVLADLRALRQILLNLAVNAVKYTDPGGRIDITVAPGASGEGTLTVADNGVGLSGADIEGVFEPFARVADGRTAGVGGAGIGLALVKKLVDLHHGRVEMASTPGVGTTVTVTLPLSREE